MKKKIFGGVILIIMSLLIVIENAHAAKMQTENQIDLSGDWKFKLDPEDTGVKKGWQDTDFDDTGWETVKVPGELPEDYNGVAWYRKNVKADVSALKKEGALALIFQQVDDAAWVYLNGELVVENHSWNTPFFADITSMIENKNGKEEFQLSVRVMDHGGPGGILQPVMLRGVKNAEELYRTKWYGKKPAATLSEVGDLSMYSVYTRNFSQEGTFDALRKRLPEIKSLGIDMIWLLPIHPIGEKKRKGEHGSPYAIKDYYEVSPHIGTKEDFRNLVEAAHEHDMKIILDLVLNHTSPDSVLAEKHPDWFIQDEEGNPRAENEDWWDVVDLDWENKKVWEYCAEMMEYWVKDLDIDGYRCDVADLMPDDFWKMSIARLEKIKPDVLMLAESTSPRQHLNGFDITYNESLYDTAVSVCNGGLPATALQHACLAAKYGYPENAPRLLFVENHDKPRAMTAFGGPERVKLASVLTATLPGIPLLYTGTEVGADPDRDKTFFVKSPVDFSKDKHGMRAFYTMLLALKETRPELKYGDLILLDAEPKDKVFAFERRKDNHRSLIIMNFSEEETEVRLKHDLMPTGTMVLGRWSWCIF